MIFHCVIGSVGTVAKAVDHLDRTVVNGRIKGSRKAGTVVVGNKGRICNIHVIAAVAAVPFQSILRVIPDRQR